MWGSCASSARCSRQLQMCLRSRDRTLLLPTPSLELRSVNKVPVLPFPRRLGESVSKQGVRPPPPIW